jgi:serine/threonine-protein kinase RsbW
MNQSIEVRAESPSIPRLMAFMDQIEQSMPLSFDQSYLMRLVIEEIATNIIKYGYDEGAPGVIQLRCSYDDNLLRVIIRDQGRSFDPRDPPDPEFGDDPASRQIGGLGIFLVREYADDLSYHHDPLTGWNELVVVKGEGNSDV